ncbi:MAG: hypothetical protein HFH49_02315 [Lachnospiraceae bacterium]|nr:hypothetical protein [Lachnospiraceae bacterium]
MDEKEMLRITVEEFDRIQDYMMSCEKDSEVYQKMKKRCAALKVILTAFGINFAKIDYIQE